MAGIDNLKSRIMKDDEDRAREITEEAKAKAEEILKQSKEMAEKKIEDIKIKAEKDGKSRRERIIARAHLDGRNAMLSAKQETIGRILDLANHKISNMSNDEYTDFIERLLLNSIETGDEEVLFAEKDKKRVNPGLVARVNDKLASQNRKGMLSVSSDKVNINAGFILRHGGVEINCSIDSQIRTLRDVLEGEIANLLFQDR